MNKKIFSVLTIAVGICMVFYASWNIAQSKIISEETVKQAQNMVMNERVSKPRERFSPEPGETVGILEIPKIEAELAIIEGTDPNELEKGVGHYKGSYYPEETGQIVLSGHRDTVFRQLGELEIGDELTIGMTYGKFSYTIVGTKIVDAEDTSIITLQNDEEELILTTCYPFRYVGNAPQRYIIYAEKNDSILTSISNNQ